MQEVTVGFHKRVGSSDAHLDLQSTFDRMDSSKYELGENEIMTSSNYLVTSPVLIKSQRDNSCVLKDKDYHL